MHCARRLLLLSCSQRKRPDAALMAVEKRYDGPLFRVLRRFAREHVERRKKIDVYILSAKFGLISAHTLIPAYNFRMTPDRAKEMNAQIRGGVERMLQNLLYHECFISLGKHYMAALSGYEKVVPIHTDVIISQGSLGRRQAELRDWLYEEVINCGQSIPSHRRISRSSSATIIAAGKTSLRGINIEFTRDQVYEIARQALSTGQTHAVSYQSWCVDLDGKPVAPKWLVSQLTGLPVSSFHTSEARRVLEQLGLEVKRI